jgi:hypothetical protein
MFQPFQTIMAYPKMCEVRLVADEAVSPSSLGDITNNGDTQCNYRVLKNGKRSLLLGCQWSSRKIVVGNPAIPDTSLTH